jgi:ParB family chromosome partitioning protein
MVTKIKVTDAKSVMERQHKESTVSAVDRFAVAAAITDKIPTGLSANREEAQEAAPANTVSQRDGFSINDCVVGRVYSVPLALIDANPLSPRHTYLSEEIDKIAETLHQGQDVAAHGYIQNGRVQLIDGGTRLRAARVTDRPTLDVKIEEPPANELALFSRARELNERRSSTTALDFAMSLKMLLDRGILKNQEELARTVKSPDGTYLSVPSVSLYLRISRMPEKVQRAMADRPETSSMSSLYAVSEIFEDFDAQDETSREADLAAAMEIVDEIKRNKLNRKQITALVKTYKQGPKTRERSAATPLEFGAGRGQVKVFGRKGQIDLTLKGLSEDELTEVRGVLMKALDDLANRKKTLD